MKLKAVIFSCDCSSIVSNVGRSVCRSVGLSVGPQRVLIMVYAQLEAHSGHSSFSSSSNCSSSSSSSSSNYSSSNCSSSSHVVS